MKLAAQGTQDEEKLNEAQYALDTTNAQTKTNNVNTTYIFLIVKARK